MIPLRDDIPSRTFPFVNFAVIGICTIVFLLQLAGGSQSNLVEQYGMIPARVVNPGEPVETVRKMLVQTPYGIEVREQAYTAAESAVPSLLTLLTCIFLHGGWMHIIGNLWILFIFGDNVEDQLGHLGYVLFYLSCGVLASASHLLVEPNSPIPTIGASGAIAGVMGAYFVFYPKARVLSVVPIVFILQVIVVPAPIFLGLWFALQFFQGTFSITGGQQSGVAWWAHIGGFAAGAALAWVLKRMDKAKPPVRERSLSVDLPSPRRQYPHD